MGLKDKYKMIKELSDLGVSMDIISTASKLTPEQINEILENPMED